MKVSTLKKNIFYSLLLTSSRFVFPLVTYPYITRILGPDKIGILNFADTYSNYFVLIAALGVPLYGVREVAKVKDDRTRLNKVVSEIALIYLLSTIICLIVFASSILLVDQFRRELTLNVIFGLNIILTFASFEWVFIGLEKFKFITQRSLLTKLIPIVMMFFLVKDGADYIVYQGLNLAAFLLNAGINLFALRKYVQLGWKNLNIRQHVSPLVLVFFSSVFISFYSMVDILILGLLSTNAALGYFSTAIKLNRIASLVIASIGNVLLPRISSLKMMGKMEEIQNTIGNSMKLTVFLTIPLFFIFLVLAPSLIFTIAGPDYESAVLPFQILSPIVVLLGISNVYSIQVLLPFSREKELIKVFALTTAASIALNLVLVPKWDYVGAACATLVTEVLLVIASGFYVNRILRITLPFRFAIWCALVSALLLPIHWGVRILTSSLWLQAMVSTLIFGISYMAIQLVFSPEIRELGILHSFKQRILKNFK